jgi:ceramide glucosyltransferase
MNAFAWFVLGCVVVASGYQLFQLVAAARFFRRSRRHLEPGDYRPPVTLLKPLKGPGLDLYANLASFCRQDYPEYQIVFGVSDPADPAIDVVRRLRRDFPHRDIVLSIDHLPGANGKVANLMHMMRHARHDVLLLSDADIRVRPDYLRTMVAPLEDPAVGLTTCLYRGRGYFGLPSVVESLLINTDFIPMVMTAHLLGRRDALGASIAVTRPALDAIGGFGSIADYLADDNLLGVRVKEAGYRVELVPYVVETVLDSVTLSDVWRHQLRWARTYRVCQPLGWFFSIVTHAMLWGVLAVVATGGGLVGWAAVATALTCRLVSLAGIMRLLREQDTPRQLSLVPLKDIGYSAIWLVSWLSRSVDWSGEQFVVEADGRLTPVPGVADRAAETRDRVAFGA